MSVFNNPLSELSTRLTMFEDDAYDKFFFEPIYHYTSAEGFRGIVGNNKLKFWFSKSDCLNDTSEGSYIDELYQKTCIELYNDKKISEDFYDILKSFSTDPNRFFDFPLPPEDGCAGSSVMTAGECEAYICCFSLSEDSLDMWRYYSKNSGGYSLKLSAFIFDEYKDFDAFEFVEDKTFSIMRSAKVIYDVEKQKELMINRIMLCYEAFEKCDEILPNDIIYIKNIIGSFLNTYQFIFKHPCFSNENEYRFIYFRPINKPGLLKNPLPEVKFRTQNGIVVPYIEITVDNANEHLEQITISPLLNDEKVVDATDCFLHHNMIDKCNVKKSELPVR